MHIFLCRNNNSNPRKKTFISGWLLGVFLLPNKSYLVHNQTDLTAD